MDVITSDLAQKIQKPPAGGFRGVSGRFPWDNIAGSYSSFVENVWKIEKLGTYQ